jgi:hypothetical protein
MRKSSMETEMEAQRVKKGNDVKNTKYQQKTVDKIIYQRYVQNLELDEEVMKETNADMFQSAAQIYGSWGEALKENGIDEQKLEEIRKFKVYISMKSYVEKVGKAALNSNEIDDSELGLSKSEIKSAFKTVNKLKKVLITENKDRVVYDFREYILAGGVLIGIETKSSASI